MNGFIGIPTVTYLFYSKDSIIETINKCLETKESLNLFFMSRKGTTTFPIFAIQEQHRSPKGPNGWIDLKKFK